MALAPPTLRDPLCPLVRAVKLRGGTRRLCERFEARPG